MKQKMSKKLTPWFPESIKPCADRPGPYELRAVTHKFPFPFHWWDGKNFSDPQHAPEYCGPRGDAVCYGFEIRWRGITKEAK